MNYTKWVIESQVFPVNRRDVDTDLIIPADFLRVTTRDGLGEHLFERIADELELEKYRDTQIIVAGDNFGCGSSREHAPWALYDFGIRVVIASSFGDIFYNNALKNGVLPVVLESAVVDKIFNDLEAVKGVDKIPGACEKLSREKYALKVALESQTVVLPDGSKYDFGIDPFRKECLMKGIDDMDYLLESMDEIKKFDKDRVSFLDTSRL
ncbi:MAG: 3-isopropylmalate dehydratase small subunit [bacterium]|nr:3-isopropylmalate dehydratase small subunit [bacterium]